MNKICFKKVCVVGNNVFEVSMPCTADGNEGCSSYIALRQNQLEQSDVLELQGNEALGV